MALDIVVLLTAAHRVTLVKVPSKVCIVAGFVVYLT
jgi:hypothetical protein